MKEKLQKLVAAYKAYMDACDAFEETANVGVCSDRGCGIQLSNNRYTEERKNPFTVAAAVNADLIQDRNGEKYAFSFTFDGVTVHWLEG